MLDLFDLRFHISVKVIKYIETFVYTQMSENKISSSLNEILDNLRKKQYMCYTLLFTEWFILWEKNV